MAGACGRRPDPLDQPAPTGLAVEPPSQRPLSDVYPLGLRGEPPADTTVMVAADSARVIDVFHIPPDHTIFAQLIFAEHGLKAAGGDSMQVSIKARPGIYAVDVATTGTFAKPALLVFHYPVHFEAPASALGRYPTNREFEAALWIGRMDGEGTITFLRSDRPASDKLVAAIDRPGTYIVAAPK